MALNITTPDVRVIRGGTVSDRDEWLFEGNMASINYEAKFGWKFKGGNSKLILTARTG